MTLDQAIARCERIALMTIYGGVTEQVANDYCDKYPDIFGVSENKAVQQDLIGR